VGRPNSVRVWDDLGQPCGAVRSDPSATAVGSGSVMLHVFVRDSANNLQMCVTDAVLATPTWLHLS
jgi:hypothetical protein